MSLNLNISIAGLDTSYPSLAVGEVLAQINSITPKESTKTPGLYMLAIGMETLEPSEDSKGKKLDPGFKFSSNLTLPNGENQEHDEMRLKSLGSFVDACLKTDQTTRPDFSQEVVDRIIAEKAKVKVVIKKSKDDTFGETEVKGYKALPA